MSYEGDNGDKLLHHFAIPFSVSREVETEKGTALLLQDCINLVTPITNDHNQHMLNVIGPWDLSAIAPFSAKFAEGDIEFDETYKADSSPALFIRENTLKPEIVAAIKKLYPSKNYRINWIREELRTVKTVMLPIYFLVSADEAFRKKGLLKLLFDINKF